MRGSQREIGGGRDLQRDVRGEADEVVVMLERSDAAMTRSEGGRARRLECLVEHQRPAPTQE